VVAVQRVFAAKGDLSDGAGRALLTAYALDRPDEEWSLLIVNRDQSTPHQFRIDFDLWAGAVQMASGKHGFHGALRRAAAQPVFSNTKGYADPDGPAVHTTKDASSDTMYEIPAASIMVVRGEVRATTMRNGDVTPTNNASCAQTSAVQKEKCGVYPTPHLVYRLVR
jgi:hypothetical protein